MLSTLYAVGSGVGDGTSHLYKVNDYSTAPKAVDIGSTGTILDALAINQQNNAAFGVGGGNLYSVNLKNGHAADIGSLGAPGINALAILPDGTLYAMGSSNSNLYKVNSTTGHATVVFNTGYTSAGDLAYDPDGEIYLTTSADLVQITLSGDTDTDVGSLGATDMFGLAIDNTGVGYGAKGAIAGSKAILYNINIASGGATKIDTIANASNLGVYGLAFDYSTTSAPTPTPTPGPSPTPPTINIPIRNPVATPTPTQAPTSTPGQSPFHSPGPVPPTPPPAARPLPAGFLRTPPKILRVSTKMVDRTPEIVIQLDQGIASKPSLEKAWYSVETAETNAAPGTSDEQHVAVTRVVYQPKTHTITLVMPRRLKLQGNVVLTVDAQAIVNLLGQQLEGDDLESGVNLVQEVDLP